MNKRYSEDEMNDYKFLVRNMTKLIAEKDRVIHSLAYDLINCSQSVELASKPFFNKDARKYRTIGKKALDSITDKGEKDE